MLADGCLFEEVIIDPVAGIYVHYTFAVAKVALCM